MHRLNRFTRTLPLMTVALMVGACPNTYADEVLYRYEGDVHPLDSSAGWQPFDPCEPPCQQFVEDGHFVSRWENGGDRFNYNLSIAQFPAPPPPPPFWVEWRFLSNQPFGGIFTSCDASFSVRYADIVDSVEMFGDFAISFEGGDVFPNLEINQFDTYRFETPDGSQYCFYMNGELFYCGVELPRDQNSSLQVRGAGGCDLELQPTINRWDFIRYGQIAEGESIVSSDPPAGVIDILDHPNLDRFIVSFDVPNYVLVDDVTVTSTGGTTPGVIMTRRLNNSEPNIVEIVLDRKLRVGETTTFTFAKVAAPNTVSYSYLAFGACCQQDGTCADTEKNECLDQGGVFPQGGQCADTQACCFPDGGCAELFQRCCREQGGTPVDTKLLCEGDADFDGLDGSCGDGCPTDTGKTEPGVCGCGVSERDRDDDTIPDCIDQCPNQDDRIDENDDGIPDCLDFLPIPTTTAWGLAILTLLLLTTAKIFHRRSCHG